MTLMLTAIAAATLLSSTAAPTANDSNQKPAKTAPVRAQNADTKYCVTYDDLVGSRITQRECKTRQQWAKQGVDVDNPSGD